MRSKRPRFVGVIENDASSLEFLARCPFIGLMAWLDGEENAADSGKPHLAHALACLGIIVDAKETGNLVDDRPLPGVAAKLIAELEQKKKEGK